MTESKKKTSAPKKNPAQEAPKGPVLHGPSLLTEQDIYLFKEGSHSRLYEKLGSRLMTVGGVSGVLFAVWAPNAERVSAMGDFNDWNNESHQLAPRWDGSGIWEGFVPGLGNGSLYKYHVVPRNGGHGVDKGDPYGFVWELAHKTGGGSGGGDPGHGGKDGDGVKGRKRRNGRDGPRSG